MVLKCQWTILLYMEIELLRNPDLTICFISTNDLPCIDSNNQCVLFLSDKRFGQLLKINISKMVVLISIITEKYVKILEIKNISKRTKNT